jgi:alpha-galactosidase
MISNTAEVTVHFSDIGLASKALVRDLWAHRDLGVFADSFGRELPLHGAGLYRIAPIP